MFFITTIDTFKVLIHGKFLAKNESINSRSTVVDALYFHLSMVFLIGAIEI